MQFKTLTTYQTAAAKYKPKVKYELKLQKLHVYFRCDGDEWNTNLNFSNKHYGNWGLWDFDVFEIFLQPRINEKSSPYYEFQISPLGQEFALKILKPRQLYFTPIGIKYRFENTVTDKNWESHFEIDLNSLEEKKAAEYYGNFHAILGDRHDQSFYSYQKSGAIKPDFHLPERFFKL